MQIGKLAKRAGVSVQTVRFYERRGLLPIPRRKESGYRIYGEEELKRLRFIRQAKTLQFSLEEIGELLRMREKGLSPCCDVINIGERHLKEVEQQIAELGLFRDELSRAIKQWKRSGKPRLPAGSICVLIERTMETNRKKKGEKSWLSKKEKSTAARRRSANAR
jgi:DNA-binding transcriptional MerR regulator